MKNTVKIFLLSAILVAMTGLSSCSFLDIDTEDKIASSEVDYSNTADMYQPVIGAYSQLRSSGIHWANAMLWFGRDDDMTSGRADDQGDALKFGYRGGYNQPNSFWAVNNAWVTMYEIIRTSNSAIAALEQYADYISEGSADYATYLSYKGEVQTIRAWAYYMLVTTFGDAVIYRDNAQTNFRRSTREHVIEYAVADLEEAAKNMKRVRPNQMEHMGAVSAFTAEALAARFYLLVGNYAKVESLTQDVIDNGNFELFADYYNLFKIPGKLCNESLMEVQVTDFGSSAGDYIGIDQWFNFMGASMKGTLPDGSEKSIGGWTFMRFNPNFIAWVDARGETVRRATSILEAGKTYDGFTVNGTDVAYNGKAYLPYEQMTEGNSTWGRNNNVRLIRYAEVLLMNAEAKVRNGKNGDAEVNLVRARAEMPALSGATVDQILDERRMELCTEWGLRYTDLVRTGKAAQVLNDETVCPRDFAAGAWSEANAYWPVPGSQLSDLPILNEDPE